MRLHSARSYGKALASVILVCLLLSPATGYAVRSCTKDGQVRVPCQDELLLARTQRFLLTLFGHSCYSLHIASPRPLEVFFLDSRGLEATANQEKRSLAVPMAEQLNASETNALDSGHVCHLAQSCFQLQQGLASTVVYNLVISPSRGVDADAATNDTQPEEEDTTVFVDLQTCDPVSPWHYIGLLFVASVGFTSMLLLLCLVGEFVLGLRSMTKLRRAMQRNQFIELPQVDTDKHSVCFDVGQDSKATKTTEPESSYNSSEPEPPLHV